jgi:hypothetical protein
VERVDGVRMDERMVFETIFVSLDLCEISDDLWERRGEESDILDDVQGCE